MPAKLGLLEQSSPNFHQR